MAHLSTPGSEYLMGLKSDVVSGQSLKVCLGPEDPRPRWLIHVTGELMLVVGCRPQFFSTWGSPQGCLSVLEAQQLVSSRKHNLRGLRGGCTAFMM